MAKSKLLKKLMGTALITVMLIVAIVSIAAITMQGYLRVEISRTQMIVESDELYNNLLSAEAWGLYNIKNKDSKNLPDIKLNKNINGITLTTKIIDQNGLYNLNYLYNANFCRSMESNLRYKVIAKIFTNLILITKSTEQPSADQLTKIINNIYEWQCNRPIKDDQYFPLIDSKWQYQKSGQSFTDVSELRLVPGITDSLYFSLRDKITALPITNANSVNFDLNSISPELYAALTYSDPISAKQLLENTKNASDAEKIISMTTSIQNSNKFSKEEMEELGQLIAINQEHDKFYVIEGIAVKGESRMGLRTLITVSNNEIRVIWRKRVI